jgi:hypothetical protein
MLMCRHAARTHVEIADLEAEYHAYRNFSAGYPSDHVQPPADGGIPAAGMGCLRRVLHHEEIAPLPMQAFGGNAFIACDEIFRWSIAHPGLRSPSPVTAGPCSAPQGDLHSLPASKCRSQPPVVRADLARAVGDVVWPTSGPWR